MTSDRTDAILRERARALAALPDDDSAGEERVDVIEFRLVPERYAIELRLVREVVPLRDLTPIPCTPPFVRGMINVRGQILTVLDVRRFFDLPETGLTDLNRVLVTQAAGIEVGILADEIIGLRTVRVEEIQSALPTLTGVRSQYLRGLLPDRLVILDGEAMLADPKITVNETVEA